MVWLVEVDEVRPKPSWDQRTAARPKAIRARLRTACTATWGSSAQAWMHRSPSDLAGSRLSAGKCGSRRSAAGCRSASPNRSRPRSRNRLGPEAEGDGQTRRRAARSPRRCRRAGRRTDRRSDPAPRPAPPPSSAPRRASSPRSSAISSARDSVVTSKRGEVQPVLGRRDDAGLVVAVERVRPRSRPAPRPPGRRCSPGPRGSRRARPRPTPMPTAPTPAAPSSPRRETCPRTSWMRSGARSASSSGNERVTARPFDKLRARCRSGRRWARGARDPSDHGGGELGEGFGQGVHGVGRAP